MKASTDKAAVLAGYGLPDSGFVLLLLSGPEPQRTHFEELLLKQIQEMGTKENLFFLLVRGKINEAIATEKASAKIDTANTNNHIYVFDYLGAGALSDLLPLAEVVVARSSRAKWTACEYSERQFVQRASEAKCEF